MGIGFWVVEQQKGKGWQSGRYGWEYRDDRRDVFLGENDPWWGSLCYDRAVVTQKYSEQQNKRLVHHCCLFY
jgi:hypothetical protein